MKKLLIMALSLLAITLFSFSPQQKKGVRKISSTMYQVSAGVKFSANDQAALQAVILKEYNLSDFKTVHSLQFKKGIGVAAWVHEDKIGPNWIEKKTVSTRLNRVSRAGQPEALNQMRAVLQKYSSNGNFQ